MRRFLGKLWRMNDLAGFLLRDTRSRVEAVHSVFSAFLSAVIEDEWD